MAEIKDFTKLDDLTYAVGELLGEADWPGLTFVLKPAEGDERLKEIDLDDIEVGPYGEVYLCFREFPKLFSFPSKAWFYWTVIHGGWELINRVRAWFGLSIWYTRLPLDSWSRYNIPTSIGIE